MIITSRHKPNSWHLYLSHMNKLLPQWHVLTLSDGYCYTCVCDRFNVIPGNVHSQHGPHGRDFMLKNAFITIKKKKLQRKWNQHSNYLQTWHMRWMKPLYHIIIYVTLRLRNNGRGTDDKSRHTLLAQLWLNHRRQVD